MMNTYRGLYGLGASYIVDPLQTTYHYSGAGGQLSRQQRTGCSPPCGRPRNPMDAGWVGLHGNVSITLDLGQRRRWTGSACTP